MRGAFLNDRRGNRSQKKCRKNIPGAVLGKVDSLATKFAASSVREERNEQEINTLRIRQHELSNDMAKTQGLLEKCKNCTKQ